MRVPSPPCWITLLALFLPACSAYDGQGVLVGPPCPEQAVDALQPRADRADVPPDALVWVDLRCPSPGATLTLFGPFGEVEGASTLHFGGRQVRFEPAAALARSSLFSGHLNTTEGVRDWEFSTGSLGEPVGGPLTGRALALRPELAAILSPPGLREALGLALPEGLHPVLELREEPVDGRVLLRLGGRIAQDPGSAQDLLRATWDARAAFLDPRYGFGPLRLEWSLQDFPLLLEDAVIEGILGATEGGAGGRLAGLWDTRPAADGLPDDPCATALDAGQPCLPCRDEVVACLPFELRDVPAVRWAGSLLAVDPP